MSKLRDNPVFVILSNLDCLFVVLLLFVLICKRITVIAKHYVMVHLVCAIHFVMQYRFLLGGDTARTFAKPFVTAL